MPGRPEFTAEQALELMDAAGVDMAVLVPPIWSRFQNEYVFECAARYPERFAAMVWFDPTGTDLRERLETLAGKPRMAGVRMLLAVPPGDAWLHQGRLQGGPLDAFWRHAEELGLRVAVRLTKTVSELGAVAESHPRLTLLVDHCAAESERGPEAFGALPDLLGLARFDRIYVKISALAKHSDMASPYPDMDPIVERVVSAFGAERCLWGSDITQYPLEYAAVVDQLRVGCRSLTTAERSALLGGTATRVFGLDATHERSSAR
jgi:L-fuconolactonase